MKPILFTIAATAALSGCTPPAPQSPAIADGQSAASFDVPMDPGAIRCSQLSNPAALSAASDWVMGQVRALVLSGQRSTAPDQASLTQNLAAYCLSNGQNTVRSAIPEV